MIKELVEDIKRYRADREINARLVLVLDNSTKTFVQRPWRDVKVSSVKALTIDLACMSSIPAWTGMALAEGMRRISSIHH